MKWFVSSFAALLLCSTTEVDATKLKNLAEPAVASWFSLDRDHVIIERRGKKQKPFVTFFSAGIYTAVAEDDQGIYYFGPLDCLQFISGADAERYLAQSLPERPAKNVSQGDWSILGGLWLPKPGVEVKPKLFYDIRVVPKNDGECLLRPGCSVLLGPIVTKIFEGSLSIKDSPDDPVFFSSLKIRTGGPLGEAK